MQTVVKDLAIPQDPMFRVLVLEAIAHMKNP